MLATQLAYPIEEPKPEPIYHLVFNVIISLIVGTIAIMLSDSYSFCLGLAIPALFLSIFALIRIIIISNENKKRQKYFDENHTKLHKYQARWSKAFYCYRDGSVFIPGEGDYSSVEDLEEFIEKI